MVMIETRHPIGSVLRSLQSYGPIRTLPRTIFLSTKLECILAVTSSIFFFGRWVRVVVQGTHKGSLQLIKWLPDGCHGDL